MARFAPGWGMTMLVAALVPVLIGLGAWQLDRAAAKRAHEMQYYARLGAPPQRPPTTLAETDFLRVRLEGRYLPDRDYLVDNQTRGGRPGYWVVSQFADRSGAVYLVNRGWLAAAEDRGRLPEVPTPREAVSVIAVFWPDLGLVPLLAEDRWGEDWPKRVQRLDVARMAAADGRVVPRELRAEAGQPGSFEAAPARADFRPERHQGYAAQWFGLAVVLLGAYVVYGLRR